MTYYTLFEGGHQNETLRMQQRRLAVIDRVKKYEPENLDDLLAASEDGQVEHQLAWVFVSDPRYPKASAPELIVRPSMYLTPGRTQNVQENDQFDKGAMSLILDGRLPSGEERRIGEMTFFHLDGVLKHEPGLIIFMDGANDSNFTDIPWASADAELWLKLAEDALEAQPHI